MIDYFFFSVDYDFNIFVLIYSVLIVSLWLHIVTKGSRLWEIRRALRLMDFSHVMMVMMMILHLLIQSFLTSLWSLKFVIFSYSCYISHSSLHIRYRYITLWYLLDNGRSQPALIVSQSLLWFCRSLLILSLLLLCSRSRNRYLTWLNIESGYFLMMIV